MNNDMRSGKWTDWMGQAKAQWVKLTKDDMGLIGGKFDERVGRLQQRYGHSNDDAENESSISMKSVSTARPGDKPTPAA